MERDNEREMKEFRRMLKKGLVAELKKRNLDTSGTKATLLERLEQHIAKKKPGPLFDDHVLTRIASKVEDPAALISVLLLRDRSWYETWKQDGVLDSENSVLGNEELWRAKFEGMRPLMKMEMQEKFALSKVKVEALGAPFSRKYKCNSAGYRYEIYQYNAREAFKLVMEKHGGESLLPDRCTFCFSHADSVFRFMIQGSKAGSRG